MRRQSHPPAGVIGVGCIFTGWKQIKALRQTQDRFFKNKEIGFA